MKANEIRSVVLDRLGTVAPDADLEAIDPDADLRDEVDIDSMDFLNLVIALHERLQIDIPEADYGKLTSLNAWVDYLWRRLGA